MNSLFAYTCVRTPAFSLSLFSFLHFAWITLQKIRKLSYWVYVADCISEITYNFYRKMFTIFLSKKIRLKPINKLNY